MIVSQLIAITTAIILGFGIWAATAYVDRNREARPPATPKYRISLVVLFAICGEALAFIYFPDPAMRLIMLIMVMFSSFQFAWSLSLQLRGK